MLSSWFSSFSWLKKSRNSWLNWMLYGSHSEKSCPSMLQSDSPPSWSGGSILCGLHLGLVWKCLLVSWRGNETDRKSWTVCMPLLMLYSRIIKSFHQLWIRDLPGIDGCSDRMLTELLMHAYQVPWEALGCTQCYLMHASVTCSYFIPYSSHGLFWLCVVIL